MIMIPFQIVIVCSWIFSVVGSALLGVGCYIDDRKLQIWGTFILLISIILLAVGLSI